MGICDLCAPCCSVMAIFAIPILIYFALLLQNDSPMLEVPSDKKPAAAEACWIAAVLYVLTFVASKMYLAGKKKPAQ